VQLFVPDLAIEIVSDNEGFNSLMAKVGRYRRCGTREAWVLSPETGDTFVLSPERREILTDDQMFESKLIPGFSIRLADLFERAQS
jgi:Uma2 family endonuclease